jgi:hypothetical protein
MKAPENKGTGVSMLASITRRLCTYYVDASTHSIATMQFFLLGLYISTSLQPFFASPASWFVVHYTLFILLSLEAL